uniref:Uncharacterized protein n=1 Tax=viral metagenome TaxID=1070528 RepID=A0A6M3LNF4_9ZZZZ
MKINIAYKYTESVIPKRCRKPRRVEFVTTLNVEIKEVSHCHAPIAIREHDNLREKSPLIYRWFDGRLWTNISTCWNSKEKYGKVVDCFKYFHHDSYKRQKEVIAQLNKCANEMIFIDNQIFQVAGEPRYVVMTFGLGCNHGGTSLAVDHSYNSNISHKSYYRIDQKEAAMLEAERIAINRGDNDSVPINPHGTFDIYIPEAIKLNPATEHGNGDPFMNSIENIIENVKNPVAAGLFAISKCYNH